MQSSETRRFDLLFDQPPTDQAAAEIAARLKCARVSRLMREWQRHRDSDRVADPLNPAVAFFRGLEAIAQELGDGVLEFIDRWSVSYLVSRPHKDDAEQELAYGRLAIDLLHCTLPSGRSPLDGLTFSTPLERDGSLLALGSGGRLFIRGVPPSAGPLIWACSGQGANVTSMSDPDWRLRVDLPLLGSDTMSTSFRPNAIANGFQIPILDEGPDALLTGGYSPDHEDMQTANAVAPERPLTLTESLSDAYEILTSVWPEVIPWVKALVPAIADMGPRDALAPRLSGSFGPGEPIYLSQVTKPLLHAEDLIHEVQHLRFSLAVSAEEWFGRWNDRQNVFISPYRPDLRPVAGIHLGLHAFFAVTEFGLRTLDTSSRDQISRRWLYETHLRNLFAFHTIASHEILSSDGKSYYRELGRGLGRQHQRIEALIDRAEQEQILSSLEWPMRPQGLAAENASLDLRRVARTNEIASLIT
jgi:HEXXH motif-containing protein